jgi:hypothetical protein
VSTMTKVFVVLTAVLSIVASVLFIASAAQWQNYKEAYEAAQQARDAEATLRQSLEATLAASLAMKDDIIATNKRLLADAQLELQELSDEQSETWAELQRARNQEISSEAARTRLNETLGVVTAELKGMQAQNKELLSENIKYKTRISQLNTQVLDLTAQATILTEEVRNLKEKNYAYEQQLASSQGVSMVDSGKLTTSQPPVVPSVTGLILGEVVEVSDTYAAVNIGETSGVVEGMTFMVYRGSTYLGEFEVTRVLPNEAGGRLSTVQGNIRPGDRVSYGASS